ncbi:MAG: putative Eukaryotic peptide chain release factor subunit 1 [Streblomastix strix]|uniref:Putative Eukaryotic peptide chain release factor subunit 1 n=1 Tax=Streblomastix strix TaxID=222440 RepID=A0A5J4USS5_9EUKA|nr:MAG: putative Eukaryotic peptide chain release factor subunit 1 [Streblomastix strix]
MAKASEQAPQFDEDERNIEVWRIKKLVRMLQDARGDGTSMITLILPPKSQLPQTNAMLAEEAGSAKNIKSRVNRISVLDAIISTQQRLKLYTKCPPNGLCIYCGTIITDKGPKKITIDFQPFKAINTSLYLCDFRFHTEPLSQLLESDDKFGFIIMDGSGALFATLQGDVRQIIQKFSVDLPKKHGRGGQSSVRFARLRMEKRHNYVRKVAETASQCFITDDKVNCTGLVLAGSADFKTELSQSELLDQRLASKVLKIVDVSYGGENGFNQAINLAAESLANVRFVQEKHLLQAYFDEIGQDSGKYVYGIRDTIYALSTGAVQKLIIWEGLEISRYALQNPQTEQITVQYLSPAQERDSSYFIEKIQDTDGKEKSKSDATVIELLVINKEPITDWFLMNYKQFGCSLHFVTNRSQEGSQFCRGFGGMGGILRYKLDMSHLDMSMVQPQLDSEDSALRMISDPLPGEDMGLTSDPFTSQQQQQQSSSSQGPSPLLPQIPVQTPSNALISQSSSSSTQQSAPQPSGQGIGIKELESDGYYADGFPDEDPGMMEDFEFFF